MNAQANFTIVDNSGKPYSSSIKLEMYTSNVMQEIKDRVVSTYNLKNVDQIKTIGNIEVSY
tara:strand:- start:4429 stop:4611 length:183 start_codon:yes stop_codon:yes gene_type:complete